MHLDIAAYFISQHAYNDAYFGLFYRDINASDQKA